MVSVLFYSGYGKRSVVTVNMVSVMFYSRYGKRFTVDMVSVLRWIWYAFCSGYGKRFFFLLWLW